MFRIDLWLYNSLLIPKIFFTMVKNRNTVKYIKRNASIKNSEKGKILYICGNGPSLNKVDMNDIKEDYLVVNDYYRFTKKDKNHPPKFYMILDESFLDSDLSERFKSIFSPGFETTYVLNGLMRERVTKEYPNLKTIYYCPWGMLFNSDKDFRLDRIHGRPWNVVCEAILFGIYLGYKEIRLLGCDYSIFATSAHFYSQIQERPNLREMLYKYCYTTEVHYEIAKYANRHGVRIINMTKETLLDAYDIDINSPY